ncbi:MAG: Ig-like domain-containing protein [Acutalibacteraceae bacterium]|nr:Ig-like domain-containing protein [Acutalibacteraceae bacterium]
MKKFISLFLTFCFLISALVSCGEAESTSTATTISAPSIVGSWSYTSDEEQNVFNFYEDGTLLNQVYMLDRYAREVKGTYTSTSNDASNGTINIKLNKDIIDATYTFGKYDNLELTYNGQTYSYNKVKPFTTDDYKEENGYFTGLWADVPIPTDMFDDGHFSDESHAYNYEIKESEPKEAEYGVNYNYFFDTEENAQEAFAKYYTYLLKENFSLPKDSKTLAKKIEKNDLDRDVDKESEFEISRNILVSNYTGEEIGVGLCYDSSEKRVVLSVTLFNDDYDPDDYVADRNIKINYVYKNVVVTKHRSNINPNNYHIVSTEIITGGNNNTNNNGNNTTTSGTDNTASENTNNNSTDQTSSAQTPSNAGIGDVVEDVKVEKKELSADFKAEAESAQRSESIENHTPMDTEAHVVNMTLSDEVVYVEMGTKQAITAQITPSEGVDTGIMWTSSNENVAIIDKDGNVYAMSPGAATITATSYDTATGISREATVVVYANQGNSEESTKLIQLINDQRSANGAAGLNAEIKNNARPQDTQKLSYLSNERAYEEAYENDGTMDNTRPDGSDNATIFDDYEVVSKSDVTFYIWGKDYDASTVIEKIKGSEIGSVLFTSGDYASIGAGYFKDDASGCIFWSITLLRVA